jgi:hypothetical protein
MFSTPIWGLVVYWPLLEERKPSPFREEIPRGKLPRGQRPLYASDAALDRRILSAKEETVTPHRMPR